MKIDKKLGIVSLRTSKLQQIGRIAIWGWYSLKKTRNQENICTSQKIYYSIWRKRARFLNFSQIQMKIKFQRFGKTSNSRNAKPKISSISIEITFIKLF